MTACAVLLLCFNISCSAGSGIDGGVKGDSLDMRYSSLLSIVECDGYTIADVANPWSGGLMHRYILVDRDSVVLPHIPQGTLLRTPLDSMLVFSTVHARLIQDLGRCDAISGVCEPQYMTQSFIKEGLENGSIVDCGSSLNINVERVVQLSPQAVWVLPYENGGYGNLEKLPFPLIECVEYMENSPLGGAEWMRFYGRLLGCAARADSLFDVVCNNYEALRDSVADIVTVRPTLMCELKSSSAWYMPGGNSTMGLLYKDAGADYLFGDNDNCGSLPLSFESVLARAADADVWLVKYGATEDKSYASLKAEFGGYAHFRPFKERNIYGCNVSSKPFYEDTPFRPDVLLRELVAIFHSHIVPDTKLHYYEKMEE